MGEHVAVGYGENRGCLLDHQAITNEEAKRIAHLERQNARLQRLVAELLTKNEQLRQRIRHLQHQPIDEQRMPSRRPPLN